MTLAELGLPMIFLILCGVFLGSFMDAIAGGGGLITLPTYLLAGLPMHIALGTNKTSASLGIAISTIRYAKKGFIDWRLALPAVACATAGSYGGTRLQLSLPEVYLKYLLLIVLPAVAFFVLRKRDLPETSEEMAFRRRLIIICTSSLVIGAYDGFYGPGAGTFLLLVFCHMAKMDVRSANGVVKAVNLASCGSAAVTAIVYGKCFISLALLATAASVLGNFIGSGLAIKNGSKIVRPIIIVVLCLLLVKVIGELI